MSVVAFGNKFSVFLGEVAMKIIIKIWNILVAFACWLKSPEKAILADMGIPVDDPEGDDPEGIW